jgi:hypothetical protein
LTSQIYRRDSDNTLIIKRGHNIDMLPGGPHAAITNTS